MFFAGTTFCALAMTCARIGLPPTSCRTLGCFDLSRVPLPAAMTAMAIRGGCGFDRDLPSGFFTMLSQYKPTVETRLAASRISSIISSMESRAFPPGGDAAGGARVDGQTPVAPQINYVSSVDPALAPSAPSGHGR